MNDHDPRRFASLRGQSRQLLDDDVEDDLDTLEPDVEAVFGDLPHDGWSEIRPMYETMRRALETASVHG
jgi:hypothetical protein